MSDVDEHPLESPLDDGFDRLARDLNALRDEAGPVSYAEIARRIATRRLARGVHAAAATPARSTVYDAFRVGRARLDPELLRDIVLALGATDDEAAEWVRRSRSIRRAPRANGVQESPPDAPATHVTVRPRAWATVALVLLASVAVNLLGLTLAATFHLTVYLDMVGTAIAAMALGPWWGVMVAIASNALGFVTGDVTTLAFAPVNAVGALVWGYGVRRFRAGRSLGTFTALQLVVAITCSAIASPIVAVTFHGGAGHASELAMLELAAAELPFIASVFATNVVTSTVDKLLSGCIALFVLVALHRPLRLPMTHLPIVERLSAPVGALGSTLDVASGQGRTR